jgi:opacity protein-like surface antigen
MYEITKQLKMTVAATSILAFASGANAADMIDPIPSPSNPWYVSIFGGASLSHEFSADTNYINTGPGYRNEFDLRDGFILGLAVGKEIAPNWRGEVEFAAQRFHFDGVEYSDPTSGPFAYDATGDMTSFTVLANVWHDFESLSTNGITPYAGGGIGWGHVKTDADFPDYNTYDMDDSDSGFAYQLGVGVNWAMSSNMNVELGYRYKVIHGIELDGGDPSAPARHDFDDWASHAVIVGVNWRM